MQVTEPVFNGLLKIYSIPRTAEIDIIQFMLDSKQTLHDLVTKNLLERPAKIQISFNLYLEKPVNDDETTIFIKSTIKPVYREGLADEAFYEMTDNILTTLFTFTASGSGWNLKKFKS